MTALIDTNVLVYDAIENSPNHNRARDIIDNSEDPVINSISIVELGFILPRYGINNEDVRMKISELLHGEIFKISWITGKLIEAVSSFIVENHLSFRNFNDWIIVYDAYKRNIPLITFDQELIRACAKLGIETVQI